MQNLFICKFSVLKIQFFPSVSVLPSSRAPLSFHPPRHPASFLVGTRLLDLGGTRALVHAAWYGEGLADEPNGMCAAFRTGKPGVTERNAQCRLFGSGNVASPVQSSFLGIVPVDVYCQICILKKCCHADCGRRTLWGERTRRSQNLFEACAHQTVAEPLLGSESTRRSRNPCWDARAPDGRRTLVEARTDGATLRRTTRQVLLNQR